MLDLNAIEHELERIDAQRASMDEHAEDGYQRPATAEQIRLLSELLKMSHASLWMAFGTLTRGTASVLISGLIEARDLEWEQAA
ncbi:hypothetical protein ACWIDW_04840 [Microbacterium sp. NPDC055312]